MSSAWQEEFARIASNGRDPFDCVAPSDIPPGMDYQWVARKQLGQIDDRYQVMVAAGWRAVPFKRHDLPAEYRGEGGTIEFEFGVGVVTLDDEKKEHQDE